MPVVPPQGEELYREEFRAPLMRVLGIIAFAIGLYLIGIAVFQPANLIPWEIGTLPRLEAIVLAIMSGAFGWILIAFNRFTFTITPDAVTFARGFDRKTIRFQNISECMYKNNPSLWESLKEANVYYSDGGWTKHYIVLGQPRIDLRLTVGFFKHIVFSVTQPKAVIEIIRERSNINARRTSACR